MKTFLNLLIKFMMPMIVVGVIFFSLIFAATLFYKKKSKQLKLKENTSVLFVGDSHIVAIPDSSFTNCQNIALRSEAYYQTYYKLKYFTNNYNINKIVIGFSYHNISSNYDLFINGLFSSINNNNLFFILPFNEQLKVLYWNKNSLYNFLKNLILLIYDQYFGLDNDQNKINDGFDVFHKETVYIDNVGQKRVYRQFFNDKKVAEIAVLNMKYFDKIFALCIEKDIEIILLTTPIHKKCINKIPMLYKEKYFKFTNGKNLINLADFPLDDSCFAPDGDHINIKGVKKLNNSLKAELRNFNIN